MNITKADVLSMTVPTPFAVGPVNCFLIKGDVLTLVDTGPRTPETQRELNEQLKNHGYAFEDIEQVVLTHHHPDHIGLVGGMMERGVRVLGHWKNDRWLQMSDSFLKENDTFMTSIYREAGVADQYFDHARDTRDYLAFTDRAKCDIHLSEGDAVPGCSEWTVMETPGHAQSHISLWHKETGTMIAGDHLIKKISSNPLLEPPYVKGTERPKPLIQQRDSYRKTLDAHLQYVYTGHGEPILNPDDLIKERLRKQEERSDKVALLLQKQPLTAFEVCKELFPGVYKKQVGLTISETIGHLDYLESENVIVKIKDKEQTYYRYKL
ncbi:MBL fold metallo-hydrolase [Guptibacillus hwajinpoensis]|uniref:MBL fold metallo-hydrolase n=1 Tax=Guptibacillus hwajinpoensis TaxID=208199 RepID=UPI001CFE7595|nr:MBL fold metallo-hydrolase [Pseudalkalibacillus hwajinpoensis]WLR60412.1 MBL fold metallo-hydrolase [Pseudalkalibacillus hwajinpoensis]